MRTPGAFERLLIDGKIDSEHYVNVIAYKLRTGRSVDKPATSRAALLHVRAAGRNLVAELKRAIVSS
jgi:hypothetical protein